MSGMLPGVEAARRRRIHQSGSGCGAAAGGCSNLGSFGGSHGFTRRSAFSLFATSYAPNIISSSSAKRSEMNSTCPDEKLGQLAREAKERLDVRLRAQRKSQVKSSNSDLSEERLWYVDGRTTMIMEPQTEVFGSKKKLMRWANKLVGWKASEQEECAVCLEQFKVGENLVNLPCAHRFHSRCLLPWLQAHAHCPCCRLVISQHNLNAS